MRRRRLQRQNGDEEPQPDQGPQPSTTRPDRLIATNPAVHQIADEEERQDANESPIARSLDLIRGPNPERPGNVSRAHQARRDDAPVSRLFENREDEEIPNFKRE